VLVETTLLVSILYMLFLLQHQQKSVRNAKRTGGTIKLSKAEEQELLDEWKLQQQSLLTNLSTVTMDTDDEDYYTTDDHTIVHSMHGRTMMVTSTALSENQDEPVEVLNLATFDFMGMSANEAVKAAAHAALLRYGCGSCGPRGFYGTIDVHLQLEDQLATMMKTEQAILYSDGASMASSVVAAFAKRGDLLVVDEAVYEPLRTGVTLSRANVKWFQHNDMQDLRRVLKEVQATDKKLGRKLNAQRRFIVVEGLYKNTGTIVPLDEVVALKHEFFYRLILDESHSFGTLGQTGRGVCELYDKTPMQDVEIMTVSMENAVGSVGGCSIGTEEVVEHQRLGGSGYCFSASAPPFTATAAMAALNIMQTQPDILQQLQDNRVYLHERLIGWCVKMKNLLVVSSDERSPIVLLQVEKRKDTETLDEVVFCDEVVRESLLRKVAFCSTGQDTRGPLSTETPPGIRLTVSAAHSHADIDRALHVLSETVDVVFQRYLEDSST
jgi:serine palmitoyltransferase